MKYEVTIGLEVHCEAKTISKMFAPSLNCYDETPNNNICEVSMGFPGTLPTVNREGIHRSIAMALALNCKVPKLFYFDRKNYYYPDLPKGFQITQAKEPIGTDGYLDIFVGEEKKRIGIHDIHLEEDTASLDHYSTYSLIDYNRAGVPLLETVTEPCMHSAEEALAFLDALRKIFIYTDISEARTDRGQMRCDVNISLAPVGAKELGTRVEMKNINSFSNVKDAIECEIKRQTEVYDNGGTIVQETRRYDDVAMQTIRMREKVEAVDYKYFTEPNIPPYVITDELVESIRKTLPILQFERIVNYTENYGISKYDATIIVKDRKVAEFYEETIELGVDPKTASNWLTTNVLGYLNKHELNISDIYLTPQMLVDLIKLVEEGKISTKQSKEIFIKIIEEKEEPKKLVKKLGMTQIGDESTLRPIIVSVLEANLHLIEEHRKGRNVFDFFVGQVMKQTRGQANPSLTAEILKEEIEKR